MVDDVPTDDDIRVLHEFFVTQKRPAANDDRVPSAIAEAVKPAPGQGELSLAVPA